MSFIHKFVENLLVPQLSLHLWSCYVWDENASCALIQGSAMSLRTLDTRAHGTGRSFDLRHYPSLRTLVLPRSQVPGRHQELLTFTPETLKTLVVFLELDSGPVRGSADNRLHDRYPWSEIDEISTSGSLEVIIHSTRMTNSFDLRERLEELLPMCARREMVQLHLPGSPIWDELHVYNTN